MCSTNNLEKSQILRQINNFRTPDPAQIALSQFWNIEQCNNLIIKPEFQHCCTTDIIFANQGPDCRLVTDEIARLLSKIKWIRFLRFACDTISTVEPLLKALEKLNQYGVKNYRVFVYVLVKDVDDTNRRCKILKQLGV